MSRSGWQPDSQGHAEALLAFVALACAVFSWLVFRANSAEVDLPQDDQRNALARSQDEQCGEAERIPVASPLSHIEVDISMQGGLPVRRQLVSVAAGDGFIVENVRTDEKGRLSLLVPHALTELTITAEFLRSKEAVCSTVERSDGRAICSPVVFGVGKTGVVIELTDPRAVASAHCGVRGFRGRSMAGLRLFDPRHLIKTGGQAIAELSQVDSLFVHAGIGSLYEERRHREDPSGWLYFRFDLGSLRVSSIQLGEVPRTCRSGRPVVLRRGGSNEQRLVFTDDQGCFHLVDGPDLRRKFGPWRAELKLDSGQHVPLLTRAHERSIGLHESVVYPAEELVGIQLLDDEGDPANSVEWELAVVSEGRVDDSLVVRFGSGQGAKLLTRRSLSGCALQVTTRAGARWKARRDSWVQAGRDMLGIEIRELPASGELSLAIRGGYDRRFGLAVATVIRNSNGSSSAYGLVESDLDGGIARIRGLRPGRYDLYWAKVRSGQVDLCGGPFMSTDIVAGSTSRHTVEMPALRRRVGRFRQWTELEREVRPTLVRMGGVTRPIKANGQFEMDTIGKSSEVGDLWFPCRMGWLRGSVRLVTDGEEQIEVQMVRKQIRFFRLEFTGRPSGFVSITGWFVGSGRRIQANATAKSDGQVMIAGATDEVLVGYVRSFLPGRGSGSVLAFFELGSGEGSDAVIRLVGVKAVDVRVDGVDDGGSYEFRLEWVSPGGRRVTCNLGRIKTPARIEIPATDVVLRARTKSAELVEEIAAAGRSVRFKLGHR